jgi:hypothetical protein
MDKSSRVAGGIGLVRTFGVEDSSTVQSFKTTVEVLSTGVISDEGSVKGTLSSAVQPLRATTESRGVGDCEGGDWDEERVLLA